MTRDLLRSRWAILAVMAILATVVAASPAPACKPSQLTANMTLVRGSAGAGQIAYLLTLRNVSAGACRVGDHPGLRLLTSGWTRLPTHVFQFGPHRSVTIEPETSVSAHVRFSPHIPATGEPQHGRCEPLAFHVRVFLTTPATGHLAGPVAPPTSVCEYGAMNEHPVAP
jgi:hypothetical protein